MYLYIYTYVLNNMYLYIFIVYGYENFFNLKVTSCNSK